MLAEDGGSTRVEPAAEDVLLMAVEIKLDVGGKG